MFEVSDGPYTINDDKAQLDIEVIHGFLSSCYWAEGVTKKRLQRAIEHSHCFGLYFHPDSGENDVSVGGGNGGHAVVTLAPPIPSGKSSLPVEEREGPKEASTVPGVSTPASEGAMPFPPGFAMGQESPVTVQTETKPEPHRLVRPNLRQIGFARVLSDLHAIAYLMDVFILEPFQGQGLGKWLTGTVLAYPKFNDVRRWILATKDAHELYRPFGFSELDHPEWYMHRFDPEMYKRERDEG